jgi:large conductance mechanosensitive channel
MKGFKQFLLRGNVVDLAVGVVIGVAFGSVVNSLVKGLLTPFIAAVVKQPDFSSISFTIHGSKFLLVTSSIPWSPLSSLPPQSTLPSCCP